MVADVSNSAMPTAPLGGPRNFCYVNPVLIAMENAVANLYLKDPDCVLIHIPKTAGSSIRKGVWQGRYEVAFGYIPQEWQHLFKFTFVRHPFDRLISAFIMFTVGTSNGMVSDSRPLTISQFVDIVLDESIIFDERRRTFEERIRLHTIPQTHPFNCLAKADYVGRYERLDEDFQKISERVGIRAVLPRLNYTKRDDWSSYLHGRDLDRAADFYREDFDILGYKI